MAWALAGLVVVLFAALIHRLRLPARAREVATGAADCLRILRDAALDDDAKARALRRQAGRFLTLFAILVGGSALALSVPLGGVWALDLAGVAALPDVLTVLARPDFLGATVLAGVGAYLAVRRLERS
jgi:hypothetical protein